MGKSGKTLWKKVKNMLYFIIRKIKGSNLHEKGKPRVILGLRHNSGGSAILSHVMAEQSQGSLRDSLVTKVERIQFAYYSCG
ncbi:MAG: hypothetical protein C4540_06350 [Candidatus Omnitrophota bacterium]|nr:MAG: hypothetical protein C4540_06350 [Candidatus Omnitrophota bacterium]